MFIKKIFRHISKNKLFFTILEAVTFVTIWRGTWGLLDKYLFPNSPQTSYLTSISIGILLLVIFKDKLID
ncbi:MAG: hypothetical protein PHO75_00375 [Candidatus Shapirobacteria bacterium]|nr:hypothetical protein [Candidatus Shapirobacteria bacterium]